MAKKKERITYIDDGRTIADMSGVDPGFPGTKRQRHQPSAPLKAQLATFFGAMKMMLLPTLVFAGALAVLYLVLMLIFSAM